MLCLFHAVPNDEVKPCLDSEAEACSRCEDQPVVDHNHARGGLSRLAAILSLQDGPHLSPTLRSIGSERLQGKHELHDIRVPTRRDTDELGVSLQHA